MRRGGSGNWLQIPSDDCIQFKCKLGNCVLLKISFNSSFDCHTILPLVLYAWSIPVAFVVFSCSATSTHRASTSNYHHYHNDSGWGESLDPLLLNRSKIEVYFLSCDTASDISRLQRHSCIPWDFWNRGLYATSHSFRTRFLKAFRESGTGFWRAVKKWIRILQASLSGFEVLTKKEEKTAVAFLLAMSNKRKRTLGTLKWHQLCDLQ